MKFLILIGGLVVVGAVALGVLWLIENIDVKRKGKRK